jgi:hypothetical protein
VAELGGAVQNTGTARAEEGAEEIAPLSLAQSAPYSAAPQPASV